MKLAVVADDLTGANDTGVQFAKKGLTTTVLFSYTQLQPSHLTEDVIVLNSDSRAIEARMSYNIVFNLSSQLKQLGVSNVFKKIDSTMRGNIGPEIDAVMDAFNYKISFVVPAFPKSNRMTINGEHFVNGVLLEKAEMAKDPASPVNESYLPKLVQKQSKRGVGLISISHVRKGIDHLSKIMKELSLCDTSKIIIIDATTDDELEIIVKAAQALQEKFLWVGSAGIASHIFYRGAQENVLNTIKVHDRNPVLVVAGSVNSITHKQIQVLKEKNEVAEIVISPGEFFFEDRRKLEIGRIVNESKALLDKGSLVVTTNRDQEVIRKVKDLQRELGLSNYDVGNIIANSMGVIAGQLIESKKIYGTVLTGGDIAGATCKVLQGEGIRVIGEVEPGIPYGKLFGGLFDGIPLVTKAGAFGTHQALSKALQKVTELSTRTH
ncbi:four-carbon acid sugar kinase family protein [Neobacillus niacini]|uniref:four-carbon acid sugar kinase family protein n=1 Tax=Neobacillus niacini TaxID=86668 RepID=UPI0020426616|nr:Hrp-dependent type III effector protein [Neobacillus niacini]